MEDESSEPLSEPSRAKIHFNSGGIFTSDVCYMCLLGREFGTLVANTQVMGMLENLTLCLRKDQSNLHIILSEISFDI